MMVEGIHVNWSGNYVKIRASVETETLGALHIVPLRGANSVEIAQGDHIWGGPRAGGLYGTCIARDDGVIYACFCRVLRLLIAQVNLH